MEIKNKAIKVSFGIIGGQHSVIPKGIKEKLTIEVIDEFAFYHFQDNKITKKFCIGQNSDGVETKYNERLSKAICKYPGMNKKEIVAHITARIKILGAKK